MAGNTGKMTREAVNLRGPRFLLTVDYVDGGLLIFKPGAVPFANREDLERYFACAGIVSQSYTLRYLLNVGKAHQARP